MIKSAKTNNWSELLILEDDITICDDFDSRLGLFMKELPADWKIAYIGFNGQPDSEIKKFRDNIYSVKNVYGCFGLIINGNFLSELINIVESNKLPSDQVIHTHVLPNYRCLSFIPFMVYVNDDYSDLWNRVRVIDSIKNLYRNTLNSTSYYEVDTKHPFSIEEKTKPTVSNHELTRVPTSIESTQSQTKKTKGTNFTSIERSILDFLNTIVRKIKS
jgi:GR25 family glycosyltransferase involved in LPS biosynthesis